MPRGEARRDVAPPFPSVGQHNKEPTPTGAWFTNLLLDDGAPAAETKQGSKKSVPKISPKKPAGPIGKKRTGGSGKGKGLHGGGKGKSLHSGGKGKMSLHGGPKVDSRVTVED